MTTVSNLIQKQGIRLWAIILLTASLYTLAFPPFQLPELAFAFAAPFLIWAHRQSSKKTLLACSAAISYLSWLAITPWLRHVTYIGWILLPLIVGSFFTAWLYFAGRTIQTTITKPLFIRTLNFLGLASLWVLFEYIRTHIFTGFPWLPLAASQWERPVMLQVSAFTGYYGVSFILVFFNLTLASAFINLLNRVKAHSKQPRCFEFYLALAALFAIITTYATHIPKPSNQEFLFTAGIVQPNIKPELKWDTSSAHENLQALRDHSFQLAPLTPDIIIWPETALPNCINHDCWAKTWAEEIATNIQIPLIIGALGSRSNQYFDAIYNIHPSTGVSPNPYLKRHLVPFGEYVPLRKFLPSFIDKAVPMDFDLIPGQTHDPFIIKAQNKTFKCGGLICYEDIFPDLSRLSTFSGADFFLVLTNDAWFGEEGAAYQHATHSVLTAVQNRRPVVRCGNNGWSGWIDEYGRIREVALNEESSVYFRGSALFSISRDNTFANKLSFYSQHGDWFVASSCLLLLFCIIVSRKKI